jgi:hypothetical protein
MDLEIKYVKVPDSVKTFAAFFTMCVLFSVVVYLAAVLVTSPRIVPAPAKVCHCHCDKCDCGDKCNHIILKPDRRGFVGATK